MVRFETEDFREGLVWRFAMTDYGSYWLIKK